RPPDGRLLAGSDPVRARLGPASVRRGAGRAAGGGASDLRGAATSPDEDVVGIEEDRRGCGDDRAQGARERTGPAVPERCGAGRGAGRGESSTARERPDKGGGEDGGEAKGPTGDGGAPVGGVGSVQHGLGLDERGVALLKKALAADEKTFGTDSLEVAETLD